MAVRGGAFGADTIVVPARLVWRGGGGTGGSGAGSGRADGDADARSSQTSLRCRGSGSSCDGQGARGVFVHPDDPQSLLCPECFSELGNVRG